MISQEIIPFVRFGFVTNNRVTSKKDLKIMMNGNSLCFFQHLYSYSIRALAV
nr:MAG TPA: hypothetical protein [Caudoviricetes sp.]